MLSLKRSQEYIPSGETALKRQRMNASIGTLYSEEDIKLLKYYNLQDQSQLQNIILLHPEFYAERLQESYSSKYYLNPEQREKYRAYSTGEQFVDKDDYVLEGEYIYGLLPDLRLYCCPIDEVRNHSHLVAGMPVKAIGHAYFSKGSLITLSNNSGHYKPTPQKMLSGLQWFCENTDKPFLFEDHSNFDVHEPHFGIQHFRMGNLRIDPACWFEEPLNDDDIISILMENTNTQVKKKSSQYGSKKSGYENIDDNEKVQFVMNELIEQFTGLNKPASASRFRGKRKQNPLKTG